MTPLEEAKSPNTPLIRLEVLSKNKNWQVRQAAAQNRNTPVNSLLELAKDFDPVRKAAISNPSFPPYLRFKIKAATKIFLGYEDETY
jgi:hypothetical protein